MGDSSKQDSLVSLWLETLIAAFIMFAVIALGIVFISKTADAQDHPFDLPMQPPHYSDEVTPLDPPITPDDDDGDDPRDTPPPVFYGEEIDTETDSIFYVLDISCSMSQDPMVIVNLEGQLAIASRLTRAKNELIRSINGLSDNFEFNIVAYACATLQWAPAMLQATDANKQSATGWTLMLFPMGATATGPATSIALADRDNRSVVLLTDGAPNCGADTMSAHRLMIQNANSQGATINVFGISASGTYRAFCQGVAADSGGVYIDLP